ncbi:tetratricopeptide repeat protein [Undibacterium squillarum]|uniref:TPR repeat protein n=1 Tax=Undibacterium squillarum TaxID=1131567 RepID=A0ABQ2Y1T1_9BURK|nr:tetratricopeptide repeat protein [Undibacterium squillarum]GGX52391.1 hypothetical protein GCM10010946_33790 [Undibacterium squillarum]
MNDMYLPAFVRRYELPADSDERTLKRTYARELKKIDQVTELEAFQDLRDSYEEALNWLRYRDEENAEDNAEVHAGDGTGAEWQTASGLNTPPQQSNNTESERDAAPAQPPETVHFQGSDPLATAKQAFERIKALTESATVSEQAIADLLREQAEHPEMLNMDARFLFETGIARYLIDGWQPGKELLFFSAAQHFDWLNRQERLNYASDYAYVIQNAINEWREMQNKHISVKSKYQELIQAAREHRTLTADYLRINRQLLSRMTEHYGSLLYLITDRAQIQQWIEQTQTAIAQAEQAAQLAAQQALENANWLQKQWLKLKGRSNEEKSKTTAVLATILFAMIVALAYFKGNSKGQQEYSGSPADIAYQQAEAALNGSNGQQRNPQMAMGLWSRAFELGRIDAGLRIAKLYKQGDGLPKDPSLALYWYEKAAQKGNQEAQANAGDMYYRGTGTNKDEVKALEYFQHCAITIPYCQTIWAIILEYGKAGKKDSAKSLELLRAAAAKEESNAQRWLAIAYLRGDFGLRIDAQEGIRRLEQTAQTDQFSQHYLGLTYENGWEVKKDLNLAKTWYLRAAKFGFQDSFDAMERLCKGAKDPQCQDWQAFRANKPAATP